MLRTSKSIEPFRYIRQNIITERSMPYRRLPTTDKARLRAMNSAIKLAEKNKTEKLAFSENTFRELKQVKSTFESTLLHYENDLQKQSEKNKEYKYLM